MSTTGSSTRLVVPAALEGERLDRALVELMPGRTRSQLAGFVRKGRVRCGGDVQTKPGALVEAGQELCVELPDLTVRVTAEEARAKISVLFEDEHLIVLDKPVGLLVHRGESSLEPSIVEYAAELFGELPSRPGADMPGIVHRLDRDTSGVLVLARTAAALEELLRQFREREVEKTYVALVHGAPRFDSDWVEEPLGRSKRHPERIVVMPEGEGRPARTFYEVRERFAGHAYLECRPKTGRTHQIRVHLGSIGHPVLGDGLYTPRGRRYASWPGGGAEPARQMLHAARIAFRHPALGATVTFEAPTPADFADALETLRVSAGA